MAEVDTLGLQVPEDVRIKLAELDLELSEGKVEKCKNHGSELLCLSKS